MDDSKLIISDNNLELDESVDLPLNDNSEENNDIYSDIDQEIGNNVDLEINLPTNDLLYDSSISDLTISSSSISGSSICGSSISGSSISDLSIISNNTNVSINLTYDIENNYLNDTNYEPNDFRQISDDSEILTSENIELLSFSRRLRSFPNNYPLENSDVESILSSETTCIVCLSQVPECEHICPLEEDKCKAKCCSTCKNNAIIWIRENRSCIHCRRSIENDFIFLDNILEIEDEDEDEDENEGDRCNSICLRNNLIVVFFTCLIICLGLFVSYTLIEILTVCMIVISVATIVFFLIASVCSIAENERCSQNPKINLSFIFAFFILILLSSSDNLGIVCIIIFSVWVCCIINIDSSN